MERKNSPEQNRREDIQGLRGIAIIYVFMFHLKQSLWPMGFVGVDIFFVLSGYLICMILSRSNPITWDAAKLFAKKRFNRIFPAYFLALVLILLFGHQLLASHDFAILRRYSLWAAAFSTNFLKLSEERDYFAELANYDFLLHTWSLAVEIQFYLVAPFLIFIRQRIRCGGYLLALVAFSSMWLHVRSEGSLSFSFTASRLWQFFVGAVAYETECRLSLKRSLHGMRIWNILTVLSLLAVSPIFLFYPVNQKFYRIMVTFATGVLTVGCWRRLTDLFLAVRLLTRIGDISYSLYLAHWPIILFFRYLQDREVLTLKDCVDAIIYSLIFAFASYYYVEQVFIRPQRRSSLLFVAFLCALLFFIIAATAVSEPKLQEDSSATEPASAAPLKLLRPMTEEIRKRAIKGNKRIMAHKYPKLPPGVLSSGDPIADELCKRNRVEKCVHALIKGAGNTSIVIVGNSFAEVAIHYILPAFGVSRIKELRRISASHCTAFRNVAFIPRCLTYTDTAMELISIVKPDVVFFNFLFHKPLTSQFKDLANDNVFRNMQTTIDELLNYTKRIVITYDHAWGGLNIPSALNKRLEKNSTLEDFYIPFESFWKRHRFAYRRLNALRCPICEHVYTHRWLCDSKKCNVFDPKTFMSYYRDNSHLGLHGIELMTAHYKELVDEMYAKEYF